MPTRSQLALCEACEAELPWQPPSCSRCGIWEAESASFSRPNPLDNNGYVCMSCQQYAPAFDRCLSVFAYEAPVSSMINKFKEHAGFNEARYLGYHLQAGFRLFYLEQATSKPNYLLPVPLHASRLRKRGFNQSALLANTISRSCQIPVLQHVCQRHASLHSQRGLNANERRDNMRKVFDAGKQMPLVFGQHVAIIDDVVTTTATVNAMSEVLRARGVAKIDIWSVARANR
ncbi:MAG: ComF family protein [Pseudohongiella sp.]|nr:ComF family protein [Pseudohongiella sp.]